MKMYGEMGESDLEEVFGPNVAKAKADEEEEHEEELEAYEDDLDAALDEVLKAEDAEARREAFLRAFRNAQELCWR